MIRTTPNNCITKQKYIILLCYNQHQINLNIYEFGASLLFEILKDILLSKDFLLVTFFMSYIFKFLLFSRELCGILFLPSKFAGCSSIIYTIHSVLSHDYCGADIKRLTVLATRLYKPERKSLKLSHNQLNIV